MPRSAMLNVSCAVASESARSAFTAGITGMNTCTTSGPISEIEASAKLNSGPGFAVMDFVGARVGGRPGRCRLEGGGKKKSPPESTWAVKRPGRGCREDVIRDVKRLQSPPACDARVRNPRRRAWHGGVDPVQPGGAARDSFCG